MNKNTISKKWLYLPIICMIFTMSLGLFIFNSTLSDWLEKKVEGGLSEDIEVAIDVESDNTEKEETTVVSITA